MAFLLPAPEGVRPRPVLVHLATTRMRQPSWAIVVDMERRVARCPQEIRAEVQSIPKAAAAQNSAGVGGQMGAQAAGPMAAMHMGAPAGMGGVMGFPLNPAMAMQMQAMQQQRMAQMQMQMQQQMQQQMMQRQMMQRQQQMQAPPQGQPQLNQLQAIKQMLQQRMQEQQQAAGHVSGQLAGGQQWAADAEESDGTHACKRGRH